MAIHKLTTIQTLGWSRTINYVVILEQKMQKGSFIINTSRGGIVNEGDLLKYLKKSKPDWKSSGAGRGYG